ncbi:MAG: NAD(P)H-hydrate dehydratase [Clostridia bacterium]|nr:NAD(P)H-hydrate dehydratase [Clostridia bacterium]
MIEVLSIENMRKSDAYTIENDVSAIELMARAALGIYKSVSWKGRIAVICGKGNNAGDGYAISSLLKKDGADVTLIILDENLTLPSRFFFEECEKLGVSRLAFNKDTELHSYEMIVDCIFGTGFRGSAEGNIRLAIEKINSSGAYVVSADINSGLNGDSGMTSLAVNSDITVSIGSYKSGHFLGMAKDYIKKLVNCDIGIKPILKPYQLIEESDCKAVFPKRNNFSNKGTYGYATLIGGSLEYSGAVKLANLALCSLKTGAGVVKLASAASLFNAISPYLLESTFYPLSDKDGSIIFKKEEIDGALKGVKALAIGMGIGAKSESYEIIKHVLENYSLPTVIDADGLNALSQGDMNILKSTKCSVILTPHPAEFERLSKIPKERVFEDPIKYAKEFAKEYGVILLLKGSTTVITDGEDVFLSNTGCSGMATAGSGDVLSGIILGICSQNPDKEKMLLNTAVGAYINGKAGEYAQKEQGCVGMVSSDTVKQIPAVIKEILKS